MRSELRVVLRPVAAVLLLVLAIAAGVVGLVQAPDATAAGPDDCAPTATVTVTETVTATPTPSVSATATESPSESASAAETPSPLAPAAAKAAAAEDCESEEPTEPGTIEPTDEPTTGPSDDVIEVDDAVFRWGVNNQSNARSHNPGSINLLAAGLANPGKAGRELLAEDWRARSGDVSIEKWRGARKGWRQATWAGLSTNANGKREIGAHGPYSNHNVVIRNGRGTVDVARRSAVIAWSGTFSVAYYGGNAIFAVKDPVLRIRDGRGTVTADLQGFATESLNPSAGSTGPGGWEFKSASEVKILDLGAVKMSKAGFTVVPRYLGETISNGSAAQSRTGKHWGAFPQPFIDFLATLGIHDQFWFSTGLNTDDTKVPLPLTVSLTSDEKAPEPEPEPERPSITNPVTTPPPANLPPSDVGPAVHGPPAPDAGDQPRQAPSLLEAHDLLAAQPAAATPVAVTDSSGRIWWIAGSLTLIAALILLVPTPGRAKS